MKERPILFSASMVSAILEGRKTQTRRIIKPQPQEEYSPESLYCEHYSSVVVDRHGDMDAGPEIFGVYSTDGEWGVKCPYGQPGDRLWVRERFLVHRPFTGDIDHDLGKAHVMYYADDNPRYRDKDKWKPSIHMPRWASRITLEITGICVERLQDISEADAHAEGVTIRSVTHYDGQAKDYFFALWEKINGLESWAANPWVWVIEFKKC